MENAVVLAKAILAEEDAEDVEEAAVAAVKCGMFQLWQKGPLLYLLLTPKEE
jgi:hypothetical protein